MKNYNSQTSNSNIEFKYHYNYNYKNNLINEEIFRWCELINDDNYEEIIRIYDSKKNLWIKHIQNILKKITRNHEYKILDYIFKNTESLSIKNINKNKSSSFTLLNENVWYNEKCIKNYDEIIEFEKIIKTFDILISNGYNFIDYSLLTNEISNKSEIIELLSNPETFYKILMKKYNRIPENLKYNLKEFLINKLKLINVESFILSFNNNKNISFEILKMINDYYTEENLLTVKLKKTESFLGALINEGNKIKPNLKEKLYSYFTETYWNTEHFVSCLRIMFNKITETNFKLFVDYIQFILSRNVDVMTWEIFKLIVERESTNITEKNIVNSLFTNLVGREDLKIYFQTIDLKIIKEKFISNIINNYNWWIENIIEIQKSANPYITDINEFRINDYGVLMMILSIAYSYGLNKEVILSTITNIIDNSNINFIIPFNEFLENANISNVSLSVQEYIIIRKYINKFYFNSSINMKDKFIIESILSNFVSKGKKNKIMVRINEINLFVKSGYFVKIKSHKSNNKLNKSEIKNIFSNLDSDLDSNINNNKKIFDIDINHINDEYPEPDKKIIDNINMFFRYSDKEIGFDDLKYFIEISKSTLKNFTYGLLFSLCERVIEEINQIKYLIEQIQKITGFETILLELKELIKMNNNLIEMLKCDNPKLLEIIKNII